MIESFIESATQPIYMLVNYPEYIPFMLAWMAFSPIVG